jgi:pimeloyl-ACP methyl ester carboxylesterase
MLGEIALYVALGLVALLVIGLLAFSYWRAALLLRPVRVPLRYQPADFDLTFEDVRIPSPRGLLAAWYLPARNGCTLICCHGINDNRAQWLAQVARLHDRSGYGALMFDFAGHGDSEGNQVTFGVREADDVEAVVAYLRQRGDVNMAGIGILGYSLGAITAVLAAARLPELRCVAIESGFADVQRDIAVLFRRFTGLPPFPFANLIVFWGQVISGVKLGDIRPVRVIGELSPRAALIISDLCDEIANEPYDGTHLFEAAGDPKELWQISDCAHVQGFLTVPDQWIQRVGDFLDVYLARPVASELQPQSREGA